MLDIPSRDLTLGLLKHLPPCRRQASMPGPCAPGTRASTPVVPVQIICFAAPLTQAGNVNPKPNAAPHFPHRSQQVSHKELHIKLCRCSSSGVTGKPTNKLPCIRSELGAAWASSSGSHSSKRLEQRIMMVLFQSMREGPCVKRVPAKHGECRSPFAEIAKPKHIRKGASATLAQKAAMPHPPVRIDNRH
jgi:hypothetical protein